MRKALPSAPWLSPLPLPLPQRITVRLPAGFGVLWYPSASLSLPPPLPQEFLRFVGVVSQEAVLIPESRRSRRTGLGQQQEFGGVGCEIENICADAVIAVLS